MPPFSYQVKRTNIGGVITILGWRDTLNPATPPTWWLGSTEFQFRPNFRNYRVWEPPRSPNGVEKLCASWCWIDRRCIYVPFSRRVIWTKTGEVVKDFV